MNLIGRTLGHFRVFGRLGSGGMGEVWLAEDLHLQRRVALKVLREDFVDAPDKRARFEREAKAVAALNHPNIVTIYSIEEIEGLHLLCMEHVEGKPLDALIPAEGLPLKQLLMVAVQVADALVAAHAHGITHRDLKPGNVVVGVDGRVKVLDFGLAKLRSGVPALTDTPKRRAALTQEGALVGTLEYMSPEQLQSQPVDHRTDLFSFGTMLHEMATGKRPFRGESPAGVVASILHDELRRRDDHGDVPAELAEVISRCLVKDVSERIGSATEVRDRLARLKMALDSGEAIAGVSLLHRLGRRVRSRTAAVAVVVALAAAGVAISWALHGWLQNAPTTATQRNATEQPPSLVVLPLANFSADPEYFVDGMTDGLIGSLAQLGGLRVISRQSAMHYKGSDKRLPQIAHELGVDYVVEGSLAHNGDRLRLRVRVVRGATEEQLWTDVFDYPATDVLALHNEVAGAIARSIEVRPAPVEARRLASAPAIDPQAYEDYLTGRHWAGKFREEDLRRAAGYFERAIAQDPEFAPAWAGLADALVQIGLYHTDTRDTLPKAEAAAERALQQDASLPEAWAALANISLARWRWSEAEERLRRALAFEASSAQTHWRYWLVLAPQLRLEEAREQIETASTLDPLSARITSNLGLQYLFERRFEDAERELRRALELDPDYQLTHGYLWVLYALQEKDPERGAELRAYVEAMGFSEVLPEYDRLLRDRGYDVALDWVAMRLADEPWEAPTRVGYLAGLLAEAGRTEMALEELADGLEQRAWEMRWVSVLPDFRKLHGDPRFHRIVDTLGLPRPPTTGTTLADRDPSQR